MREFYPSDRMAIKLLLTAATIAGSSAQLVQRIAVPSYFYPCNSGYNTCDWDRISNTAASAPASRPGLIAIINPDSGPGKAPNADYVAQVGRSVGNRTTVIGYVPTDYANANGRASLQQAMAWVDNYADWYPGLTGIFVDEVPTACEAIEGYYAPLAKHILARFGRGNVDGVKVAEPGATGFASLPPVPNPLIVLNPGTADANSSCYLDAGHIIVTFEGSVDDYLTNYSRLAPAWTTDNSSLAPRLWHIVHSAPATNNYTTRSHSYASSASISSEEQPAAGGADASAHESGADPSPAPNAEAVTLSKQLNAGWIYVTDALMPNPYSRLPPILYFDDLMRWAGNVLR